MKYRGLDKHLDNKTTMSAILKKFPYSEISEWEKYFIEQGKPKEEFSAFLNWMEVGGKLWERLIVSAPVPAQGGGKTFFSTDNADAEKKKGKCHGCQQPGHLQ